MSTKDWLNDLYEDGHVSIDNDGNGTFTDKGKIAVFDYLETEIFVHLSDVLEGWDELIDWHETGRHEADNENKQVQDLMQGAMDNYKAYRGE